MHPVAHTQRRGRGCVEEVIGSAGKVPGRKGNGEKRLKDEANGAREDKEKKGSGREGQESEAGPKAASVKRDKMPATRPLHSIGWLVCPCIVRGGASGNSLQICSKSAFWKQALDTKDSSESHFSGSFLFSKLAKLSTIHRAANRQIL